MLKFGSQFWKIILLSKTILFSVAFWNAECDEQVFPKCDANNFFYAAIIFKTIIFFYIFIQRDEFFVEEVESSKTH